MSRVTRLSPGVGSGAAATATEYYGFLGSALPKWRSALMAVRTGTGQAKLLFVGDSTTIGQGAGVLASIPARLTTLLNSYYAPAVNGLSIPRNTSIADARWTLGTGWSYLDTAYSWGKRAAFTAATSASGNLVFDPGIQCDTFDVYHLTGSATGTTVATVAGTPTSIVTAGSSNLVKTTITRTAGLNTISFAPPTVGTVYICGVDAYLSTASQIRVGNAGVASSTTVDWAYTADNFNSTRGIQAHAPDLTVCMLGINDARNGPTSDGALTTNITAIATAAKLSGDFIVMSVIPTQLDATYLREKSYRDSVKVTAAAQGWPMIDILARFGSWTIANSVGFMVDDAHGSAKGYADIASAVFAGLRSV